MKDSSRGGMNSKGGSGDFLSLPPSSTRCPAHHSHDAVVKRRDRVG
jgi:hypothetical protein